MTKSRTATVLLAILLALVPACMSFEIEGSGDFDKGPDAQNVSETIHGSFWGFMWATPEISKCEKGFELYRIEYHHNALYVLASVASLGLYVPQSVEWWCVPREVDDDEGPSLRRNDGND